MFFASIAVIFISLKVVSAQTPPFIGALTLEPGLTIGKCITAASNTDGANVTIQDCTYTNNQKWTFTGGTVQVFGTKCLDVPNGSLADGTHMQIWTCTANNANQQFYYTIWDTGYNVNDLPQTSQDGQFGVNNCGQASTQTSNCQTAYLNVIGDTEHDEVAWCTKSGRGTRLIPDGALQGVHFVKTPNYVQVTGVGDLTKLNIKAGDSGGELDNRGADGRGNPAGGLVFGNTFGNGTQYHEWTSFISDTEFCFRACTGAYATVNCNHIYDVMGCYWNIPANYGAGTFETCDGDNDLPMGVYGTSTWYQGVSPTPPAHPAASSSNCVSVPTVSVTPTRRRELAIKGSGIPAVPSASPI
ncbi:hypothetical protein H0H92_003708 [Tricholoma furcatifolium]|nr:hypothetical protein H0H92_003708 [Tricholoma furcatifolium]